MSRTGRRVAWIAACVALVVAAVASLRTCGDVEHVDQTSTDRSVSSVEPSVGKNETAPRPHRERSDKSEPAPVLGANVEKASPAPVETQSSAAATGVTIEVVDEDGNRVRDGTVKLNLTNMMKLADFGKEWFRGFAVHDAERPLAASNPLDLRDLTKELDGYELEAVVTVPGCAPIVSEKFVVHAGKTQSLRVTAPKPRTAVVLVVDRTTDLPVANASVVSVTELERRGADTATARGTVAPGAAVTGADGSCRVEGLGAGEHKIEVDAKGYAEARADWTGDDLRVRIEPYREGGTVTVTVMSPDGNVLAGIGVRLHLKGERLMKTDSAGRAVFTDVAPGLAMFSLDMDDWAAACTLRNADVTAGEYVADVEVEAGHAYQAALGFVRGTSSIDGRLVAEDGKPIPGVTVSVWGPKRAEAESDDAGVVRLADLPPGTFSAWANVESGASWSLDHVDVAAGARATTTTWTLGANTIRGRVVAGAEHRGAAGVDVSVSGAASGWTKTDAEGRFEVPRARTGTYDVDAHAKQSGARTKHVSIPSDGEIVLELIEYGGLAVRFLAADRPQLREAKVRIVAAGQDADAGRLAAGTADDDLVATNVLPGRYEIEVALAGRTRRFPVEVTSGAVSRVEIRAP